MIKFRVIQRKNPLRPAEKKFYPKALRTTVVDAEGIAKEISYSTTFTEGDTLGLIRTISEVIAQHILRGNSVKLDKLGIFSVGLRGRGAESAKEFKAQSNVKNVVVNFRPDRLLKSRIQPSALTFQRVDEHGKPVEETESPGIGG